MSNKFQIQDSRQLNLTKDDTSFDIVFLVDETNKIYIDETINLLVSIIHEFKGLKRSPRISLVVYNNTSNKLVDLISDLNVVKDAVSSLKNFQFSNIQSTDLGIGLKYSKELLEKSIQIGHRTRRLVILLTDAEYVSNKNFAKSVAKDMKQNGISIVSFSIGEHWDKKLLEDIVSDNRLYNKKNITSLSQSLEDAFKTITERNTDVSVKISYQNLFSIGESISLFVIVKNQTHEDYNNISIRFEKNEYFDFLNAKDLGNLVQNGEISFWCNIDVNSQRNIDTLAQNCVLSFKLFSGKRELLCSSNRVVLSPEMFMKDIVTMGNIQNAKEMRMVINGKRKSGKSSFINLIHRIFSMNNNENPANVGTREFASYTTELQTFKIENASSIHLNLPIVLRDKWGIHLDEIDKEIIAFQRIMEGRFGEEQKNFDNFTVQSYYEQQRSENINDINCILVDIRDIIPTNGINLNDESFTKNKELILEAIRNHCEIARNYLIVVTHSDLIEYSSSLDPFNITSKLTTEIERTLGSNNHFSVATKDIFIISNEVKGNTNEEKWVNEFRRGLAVIKMFKNLHANFEHHISRQSNRIVEDNQENEVKDKNSIRVKFVLNYQEKTTEMTILVSQNNLDSIENKIKAKLGLNNEKLKYKIDNDDSGNSKRKLIIELDEIFSEEEYYQSLKDYKRKIYVEVRPSK